MRVRYETGHFGPKSGKIFSFYYFSSDWQVGTVASLPLEAPAAEAIA
jgi:hypothetical protein